MLIRDKAGRKETDGYIIALGLSSNMNVGEGRHEKVGS